MWRWPGRSERHPDRSEILITGQGSAAAASRRTSSIWRISADTGLPEVADYWKRGRSTQQQHRIVQLVVQNLFGTVTGKRLAVLGFVFEADTNDTRERRRSASAGICWRRARSWRSMTEETGPDGQDLKQKAAEAADALSGTSSWVLGPLRRRWWVLMQG